MEKLNDMERGRPSTAICPELKLVVESESLSLFTSILQYGMEVVTLANTPLGKFLVSCPGISEEYLADSVQTIFLNGTAVDDLHIPLAGEHPLVALSAAMPGLAGAIFRKGGLHASLRTATKGEKAAMPLAQGALTVTLKLFNAIARDKGELILGLGAVMSSAVVASFLEKREELWSRILRVDFAAKAVRREDLRVLLSRYSRVKLCVTAGSPK